MVKYVCVSKVIINKKQIDLDKSTAKLFKTGDETGWIGDQYKKPIRFSNRDTVEIFDENGQKCEGNTINKIILNIKQWKHMPLYM